MSNLYDSSTTQARSALAEIAEQYGASRFTNGSITLEELPLLGMIRLQGPAGDAEFLDEVEQAVIPIPAYGKISTNADMSCLWLTPKEWLIVTPAGGEDDVLTALAPVLQERVALATMITDSRLALEISGSCAAELLSKGCALDLHRSKFEVGHAAITRFAKTVAMIARLQHDRYQLYVDRSHARYTWEWLVDAATEFA